jgi:hypothetical protein
MDTWSTLLFLGLLHHRQPTSLLSIILHKLLHKILLPIDNPPNCLTPKTMIDRSSAFLTTLAQSILHSGTSISSARVHGLGVLGLGHGHGHDHVQASRLYYYVSLDFAQTQAQLQGITCLAQIPLTLPNPSLPPSSVEQLHTNHVPGLSCFVLLLRETSGPRVLCANYLTP